MQRCEECGKEISMPYTCSFCGEKYCSEHRLPENHSCDGLSSYKKDVRQKGKVYDGPSPSTGARSTGGSGFTLPFSVPEGNVTYYLLAVIAVVFVAQHVAIFFGPRWLHQALFVIHPANLGYVWTWVTSVFAHAPLSLGHIFINSLVLFFFGTVLERRIGSKRFLALFLVGGLVAGLAQATTTLYLTPPTDWTGALGASGAIAAVLGTLTVLNPNLRVYLWFFIPMPLWFLTIAFAGYDLFFAATGGAGAGGVARIAHLSGLALGLAYGWKLKQEGVLYATVSTSAVDADREDPAVLEDVSEPNERQADTSRRPTKQKDGNPPHRLRRRRSDGLGRDGPRETSP
ncbi:MAG: rhomboid family intramembrane serine protease [Halobacteriales archaeon]|nr:rhomboid family intramembrane serine protease [Halobacteriales archaeon]